MNTENFQNIIYLSVTSDAKQEQQVASPFGLRYDGALVTVGPPRLRTPDVAPLAERDL